MLNVYEIKQFDTHFSNELCSLGMFTDENIAIQEMMDGLEKQYPGFKEDVHINGSNQWITDKFDFGILIKKIALNNFGEL